MKMLRLIRIALVLLALGAFATSAVAQDTRRNLAPQPGADARYENRLVFEDHLPVSFVACPARLPLGECLDPSLAIAPESRPMGWRSQRR